MTVAEFIAELQLHDQTATVVVYDKYLCENSDCVVINKSEGYINSDSRKYVEGQTVVIS